MTVLLLILLAASLLGWELHARMLRAALDRASTKLDKAYRASASLQVELRTVTADRDAIAARAAELERAESRTFVRSFRRRRALVRIARYCRETKHMLDVVFDAGTMLDEENREQIRRRDEAIDALTARVAELMPCADRQAFTDGELSQERADAFRAHLRGCKSCRERLGETLQIEARLTTMTREAP